MPLRLYIRGHYAKVELVMARGRRQYDRRRAITSQVRTLLYSPGDWFSTGGPMPRNKKQKREKKPETTAEFIERMARQDVKRNGLKRRVGLHHR